MRPTFTAGAFGLALLVQVVDTPAQAAPPATAPDPDGVDREVSSPAVRERSDAAAPAVTPPAIAPAPDTDAFDEALPNDDEAERDAATGGPELDGYQSAFGVAAARRDDPYGKRPSDAPHLRLDQVIAYALDNPAIKAAEEDVRAMEAQLRKAKFAWVPIITTEATLMPGVNIRCDDLLLDDGTPNGFDFQWCRASDDPDFNINTVEGYFDQLSRAGVRFEMKADILFPITGFGKLHYLRKTAEAGVAIQRLKKLATEQEVVMRVHQAHSALLLARESAFILAEAKAIADKARGRVEKDLGGTDDDWGADVTAGNPNRDPDDLPKVRLALLDIEEKMRQALKVESLALSALWALAGSAAPRGFDVAEAQLMRQGVQGGLRSLGDYKQMAARNRPEARMASAGVQARQAQERLARAMFLPDLGLVVRLGFARANAVDREMSQIYYNNAFNFSRVTAALALQWKWDFHFKAFDLQAAQANLRSAEYQREAARLLLGRDVEEAYADLVEAMHMIAVQQQAVQLSRSLVVSGEQRDAVGGGNAAELLRNLEKWYQRRFDYVEAVQQYNVALARLSRAVGTSLFDPKRAARTPEEPPS